MRPLVAATIALLLGTLLGIRLAPPPAVSLTAALLLLLATVTLLSDPAARLLALAAAFAATGAALGGVDAWRMESDCRARLADATPVEVTGVLGARALAVDSAWAAPLLPLEGAQMSIGKGRCAGPVRVRLPPTTVAAAGTVVTLRGAWLRSGPPVVRSRWPRDPYFAGFVASDSLVRQSPARWRDHPLLLLRGRTEARLALLFPRHAPLVHALLLGRRERMEAGVRDTFARAGLVHLLAISGAHVALLAGMMMLGGSLVRLSRERAMWVTMGVTAAYLSVIGAPASAVRAGIMLSLALGARLLQRPSAALPMVAAAAMALIAWQPSLVLDAGFQLSFAGVLALLLAARMRRLALPGLRGRPWVRGIADALLVSTLAFVLTAPITAHHFGTVAPVSILANLPAIPLTSLALAGVLISLLAHPILPPAAGLMADGTAVVLDMLARVASAAAAVPHGSVGVTRPEWTLWLLAAAIAATVASTTRWLPRRSRWAIAGAAALLMALAWSPLTQRPDGALEIHFLDVGQGDAIAIRTPARRWILIDAGPASRDRDAGERRILPFLRAHRVQRLEALILTHPDLDHIGGAATLLRGATVGRLIEPGLPVGKEAYLSVLRAAEERGVPWSAARAGRVLHADGVELRFLWPRSIAGEEPVEANRVSAVVMLRYGSFGALFTGDAPEEVEERLAREAAGALRANVLKAGHHGSATSTSAALLDAVSPELVVVSAGRRNRYGHPAPEVIERIRERGIEIARTDERGTISLRVAPDGRFGWVDP